MSKKCEITGKKVIVGNNVSHSRIHTKRTFASPDVLSPFGRMAKMTNVMDS